MTLHLIKLCVGVDTVQELKDWQTERLRQLAVADDGYTVTVRPELVVVRHIRP